MAPDHIATIPGSTTPLPRRRRHPMQRDSPDAAAARLLDAAADVFDPARRRPYDWSQFAVALDAAGRPLADATDPAARSVCIAGAIAVAEHANGTTHGDGVTFRAVQWLRDALNTDDIVQWNADRGDSRTHVQATLHRAARHALRGGWSHVDGIVPDVSEPPSELVVVRNRKASPPAGADAMRADRAQLLDVLRRQRADGAPAVDQKATLGRIAAIDGMLRHRHGIEMPPPEQEMNP